MSTKGGANSQLGMDVLFIFSDPTHKKYWIKEAREQFFLILKNIAL